MISACFNKGEIRRFEFVVLNESANAVCVITRANWTLIEKETTEIVASAYCSVEENKIEAIVPLNTDGIYILEVTAEVPPEILKERIEFKVTG